MGFLLEDPQASFSYVKLRLNEDSIRFRLRQSDVQALLVAGWAESSVALSGLALGFGLRLREGEADVTLEGSRLTVFVPVADAQRWASAETVGLEYILRSGTRLLVEKDFACLEPRPGESNEGTFARPVSEPPSCHPA